MGEERLCHICGTKMKDQDTTCKKCKADPSERIIADCRGVRYANSLFVSTYMNLILTDRRLLGFEDIKGALAAGVVAGVAGGLAGGLGGGIGVAAGMAAGALAQDLMGGEASVRPVAKGINGSLKFEALRVAITDVRTETNKKGLTFTIIEGVDKKPVRIILGTSFDGVINADTFRSVLINMTIR